MQALNTDGELDPSLISVDKFISLSITDSDNNNEALVFGKEGKDADFIVMLNKDFEGAEEDLYYGVVTDAPYKSGGSYYATINVFGEGEKDYKIDNTSDFPKAKVVCFKFNNKGEATIYKESGKELTVKDKEYTYDDGYVKIDNTSYKVDSSAVLYSLDDSSKIDKKISRTTLKNYKYINYVLDDSNVIVAATVSGKATGDVTPPTPTTGTVTYINTSDGVIMIGDVSYQLANTVVLYGADGKLVAAGKTDVLNALTKGDEIGEVTATDGVISSIKAAEKLQSQIKAENQAAVNAAIEKITAEALEDVDLTGVEDENVAKTAVIEAIEELIEDEDIVVTLTDTNFTAPNEGEAGSFKFKVILTKGTGATKATATRRVKMMVPLSSK